MKSADEFCCELLVTNWVSIALRRSSWEIFESLVFLARLAAAAVEILAELSESFRFAPANFAVISVTEVVVVVVVVVAGVGALDELEGTCFEAVA